MTDWVRDGAAARPGPIAGGNESGTESIESQRELPGRLSRLTV